jgi:hypothetical protein
MFFPQRSGSRPEWYRWYSPSNKALLFISSVSFTSIFQSENCWRIERTPTGNTNCGEIAFEIREKWKWSEISLFEKILVFVIFLQKSELFAKYWFSQYICKNVNDCVRFVDICKKIWICAMICYYIRFPNIFMSYLPVLSILSRVTCQVDLFSLSCPVLFKLSCTSCLVLSVMSGLLSRDCPVRAILSQLPCPAILSTALLTPSPVVSVMSWSVPFCSVQAHLSMLTCQADLSRLTCPCCPVQVVLSQMSYSNCPTMVIPSCFVLPSCPALAVQPLLSCSGHPVLCFLSWPHSRDYLLWMSSPGCPSFPVLHSCTSCPVHAVMFWPPCHLFPSCLSHPDYFSGSPVQIFLSCPSVWSLPPPLSLLSCLFCHVVAVPSYLLSPGCPFLGVLYQLSCSMPVLASQSHLYMAY